MQRKSAQTPWATIRHVTDRGFDGRGGNPARFGPGYCGKALLNQLNSPLVNQSIRHLVNTWVVWKAQKGA
jgi:hypothetical protein